MKRQLGLLLSRKSFILASGLTAGILAVTTAWALTLSDDREPNTRIKNTDKIIEQSYHQSPHAPEPASLLLFGSGIIGMIMSFVRKTYLGAKRVLDIFFSAAALILLSPVFVLIALFILFNSPGPIFFKQERVGKDGALFKIYKFRTMMVDAEKETGPVWAANNDPRLIFGGRLLRKMHIDEIPQFFNVLKGDMSVIGPRPERPVFVKRLKNEIKDYEKRLRVKPGITGLAQVRHRYDETIEDVRKKIKYDLLYIKHICLWVDLRILLRTARVVVTGEGAR